MNIFFTRDSVCMGDDIFENKLKIEIDENHTYEQLFKLPISLNFLPQIYGNDVVWVLKKDKNTPLISYFTKIDKFYRGYAKETVGDTCREINSLHFEYYSSPIKWGEEIFVNNGGSNYSIWHEGWLEEYKSCCVSEEIQQKWLEKHKLNPKIK